MKNFTEKAAPQEVAESLHLDIFKRHVYVALRDTI